jgi:hypothetical protein
VRASNPRYEPDGAISDGEDQTTRFVFRIGGTHKMDNAQTIVLDSLLASIEEGGGEWILVLDDTEFDVVFDRQHSQLVLVENTESPNPKTRRFVISVTEV